MHNNNHFVAEYLICRQCGQDVTPAEQLRAIPSKVSLAQRNDTILGVKELLIQVFENPQGKDVSLLICGCCGGGILLLQKAQCCVQAQISLQNRVGQLIIIIYLLLCTVFPRKRTCSNVQTTFRVVSIHL